MRILITGARGMVGSATLNALCALEQSKSCEIYACTHTTTVSTASHQVIPYKCNMLDTTAVNSMLKDIQPNCLVHLAWGGHGSKNHNVASHWEWLKASLTLAEAFGRQGGKRLIATGSVHEYSPTNHPRNETTSPTVPSTQYGRIKLALSHALTATGEQFNFSVLWPRLPYVIGPNCAPSLLLGEALNAARTHSHFTTRINEQTVFELIDSRDAGKLIAMSIFNDLCGIINFGSGHCINIAGMVRKLFSIGNQDKLLTFADQRLPQQTALLDSLYLQQTLEPNFHFYNPEDCLTDYLANGISHENKSNIFC